MDGYRDLYRVPVSTGYYTRYPLGHGGEGRSPYLITAADALYSRPALDAYAGYATPLPYQPELISLPQYSAPVDFSSPRRRRNPNRRPARKLNTGKGRPAPALSLAPQKKPFKKMQKDLPVESLGRKQKRGSNQKLPLRGQKTVGKAEVKAQKDVANGQKSSAEILAKETQELHKLFRTGVDSSAGKKNLLKVTVKQSDGTPGKNIPNKATPQKRKLEEEKKREPPSSQKKRKGRKRFRKERKQAIKEDGKSAEAPKAAKADKVDPVPLTEAEKKEMDLALELQHAACKTVGEFLGISEKSAEQEPEKNETAEAADNESHAETPVEAQVEEKLEVAQKLPPALTPEEEKELEEKGYSFFSKMLEENSDLRKLYLEKKDAGTFECLVCHSVDPETSKKFNNLTSLVMHTSMRKQKRPEHRGYGKAICDVLGWESLRGAQNRPAKQVKDPIESTKQVEVEEVNAGEVTESKEEGPADN